MNPTLLLMTTTAAVATLTGCAGRTTTRSAPTTPVAPDPAAVTITEADNGRVIKTPVGDRVEVHLRGTHGLSPWSVPTSSNAAVLALFGQPAGAQRMTCANYVVRARGTADLSGMDPPASSARTERRSASCP
jgi:hypothetical protein